MTERVDIANLALSWLGEKDITSLEDDSESARQMRINYIAARDATLEAHDWSFAIKRFIPGENETPPEYGPANAFEIPADCLRVISVDRFNADVGLYSDILGNEQVEWVLENDQILTNEAAIYCRGVFRITQEGKFSPLFVHAFAAKLAMLCSLSLTASSDIHQKMVDLFDRLMKEAKTRDGLQGRSKRIRNRSLLKVR